MQSQVILWASYLAMAVQALAIILFISRFDRFPKSLFVFAGFLMFSLIVSAVSLIMWHNGTNNLPILHFYTLGEFILLSWFYREIIEQRGDAKLWFNVFIIGVTLLILLNTIILQPITQFNSYAKTLVQVIIIAYSILYFYYLTNQADNEVVEQKALRLINSALIVYYSGSLFIFMFSNYFIENDDNLIFWVFNSLLNLTFQLLILIAIWRVAFREMKSHL